MTIDARITGACPDDELLTGFVEHRLPEIELDDVERHVAGCRECTDVVAAALAAEDQPFRSATARLLATEARHRWTGARPLLTLAAGLLVVLTAATGYLAVGAAAERAGSLVAERVLARTGSPVVIGGVAVRIGGDLRTVVLRLRDVALGGPDMGHSAAAVDVVLALAPLWRGEARVEEVRLVRPVLRVETGTDGAASEASGVALRGGSLAALLGDSPLEIVEGVLVATTAGMPGLTLTRLDGRAIPEHGTMQIAARATLDAGSIHVTGSVPVDAGSEFALAIDGRAIPLAALALARDHLVGTADLRLWVGGPPSAPRLRGALVARGGRLVDANPIAAIVADTPAATVLAGIAPELAGAELPFDELRAAFAAAGNRLRVPRVFVARQGVTVAGTLRVEPPRGVHGGGAVRMPAAIADALLAAMPALASQREPAGTMILPFAVSGSVDAPRFTRRF